MVQAAKRQRVNDSKHRTVIQRSVRTVSQEENVRLRCNRVVASPDEDELARSVDTSEGGKSYGLGAWHVSAFFALRRGYATCGAR